MCPCAFLDILRRSRLYLIVAVPAQPVRREVEEMRGDGPGQGVVTLAARALLAVLQPLVHPTAPTALHKGWNTKCMGEFCQKW